MYGNQIPDLFRSISTKKSKPVLGFFELHVDQTITVENLVKFLKKKGILFNVCPKMKDPPSEEPEQPSKQEGEGEGEGEEEAAPQEEAAPEGEGEGDEEAKKKAEEEAEKIRLVEEEEAKYRCPDDMVNMTELLFIVERYYNEESRLETSLAKNIKDHDYNKEYKTYKATANHYLQMRGVEMILFEFKEILLSLALLIKG